MKFAKTQLILSTNRLMAMSKVAVARDGGEDFGQILAEVRKTQNIIEQKMQTLGNNEDVAKLQEKMDKLNGKLDDQEKKSSELTTVIETKKAQETELNERIDGLEKKMSRLRLNKSGTVEQSEQLARELKFLNAYARNGAGFDENQTLSIKGIEMSDLERKDYLRSDSNADGGFLMEHFFDNSILKPQTEISPVRQLATSRRIDALSMTSYTRDSLLSFSENGEGVTDWQPSNSTYGDYKIPVHSMQSKVEITTRALNGSRFSMEAEINSDFNEAMAELQGRRFVKGDGVNRPKGFMSDTRVGRLNSGVANAFDFNNLITLTGELKSGYNPIYGMNRRTLAFIRTLKDDAGNYIWREGNLGAGIPNQINGHNYTSELIDMDDIGAGNEPVIFADFRRLYTIVDSFQVNLLRNPYKKDGYVIFTIESFYGGGVVQPEAGLVLKCATS